MASDAFISWNTYVLILRHLATETQSNDFEPGCPVRNPTLGTNDEIVALNGIVYVGLSMATAAHQSFTTLIAAYNNLVAFVANVDTGELRFYNNPAGDVDVFWAAEKLAIGKLQSFDYSNKREVTANFELGQKFSSDLKSGVHEVDIKFEKLYIDKKKIIPAIASPIANQYNFLGPEILEGGDMDDLIVPDEQSYYLIIMYELDKSGDTDNFGRIAIAPCCKVGEVSPSAPVKEIVKTSFSAKATYIYTLPRAPDNVQEYAIAGVP